MNDLDWAHVAEEIEDAGLSELHAAYPYLRQILVHLLKLHGWVGLGTCLHWRSEIVAFQTDSQRRFAPSMRPRIDLAALFARAVLQIEPPRNAGKQARSAPQPCLVTLDELLTLSCGELEAACRLADSSDRGPQPKGSLAK